MQIDSFAVDPILNLTVLLVDFLSCFTLFSDQTMIKYAIILYLDVARTVFVRWFGG